MKSITFKNLVGGGKVEKSGEQRAVNAREGKPHKDKSAGMDPEKLLGKVMTNS